MASAGVPAPATFESMKLQVGSRLQMIQRAAGGERTSYTTLVGFAANEFMMLRLPQENGLSLPVSEEEVIRIRVFSGLGVYSFTCQVETIFLSPRSYMIVSFPRDITGMTLRRSMRVRVDLPVMINSNATAVMSDLSTAGAQVTAELPLASVGDQIAVSFAIRIMPANTDVKLQTTAVVQSVRERRAARKGEPPLVDHGLQFQALPENEQMMLQNFIYEMLLENRGI